MLINCFKVLIIAMLPVIELRGAIPFAIGWDIPLYIAFPVAILGNMLPVPFILLFFDKAKIWFKDVPLIGSIFRWVDKKAASRAKGIHSLEFWAILTFVAIPLPGTGAWTGSVLATALGMNPKKSILSVTLGVLIAGIIVSLVSFGVFAGLSVIF